ncbi:Beta-1,3-glucosyltransferase [Carex littledalei]|uniref:Beta-1,3-glucosyltransferase n=1 Tax=Carex littledalei TaxID=544730 RepID=A0A833RD94_9POAL|nr:Beta-1,3-glucosyltransferase [Carex littledalei]
MMTMMMMMMKAWKWQWHLSQPTDAAASSSAPAPASTSLEIRRHCTSTTVCFLILASCTLVAYAAFFSEQLRLPWTSPCTLCPSALYNPNHLIHIPVAPGPASPSSGPTDLSHIVFAIGGSAHTWDRRRSYTELWWRHNYTRGHVWLDHAPIGTWPDTSPPYMISRNMSRYGNRASASRIAAAVVEAYHLVSLAPEKEQVRWFVMGDDDTVFFVENLIGVLQKYDHEQMYYLGMPSESVEQDVMHSYGMAFGGGGFAISYPAVAELAGVMDTCLDRYAYFYGSDQRIQSCLAELGIPLTREPGFHQVDVRGDIYGMLAAHPIAPLVSLHHLDYVKPIIPNRTSQLESLQSLFSAYRVDPARILQQAFCYDAGAGADAGLVLSVSVSWGYTVQVYPSVRPPRELETPLQTFKTWRSSSDGPFIFNTRPLSHPNQDPCARPFIYFFDRVLHDQTDASLTQYTSDNTSTDHAQGETKAILCNNKGFSAASRIDRVRVLAPKMDPFLWKQAPRRHCCTARRTKWGRMLEVQIKYCSPGESTMTPLSI